jgi:hypothetical protein
MAATPSGMGHALEAAADRVGRPAATCRTQLFAFKSRWTVRSI